MGIFDFDKLEIFKKSFLTLIIFSVLFVPGFALLYGQEDNLEVKGKIEATTLTIKGGDCLGGTAFPLSPVKGQVYYCTDDEHKFYTYNGTEWQPLLSDDPDKRIATKIVAAYNSLWSTVDGSDPEYKWPECTNCCLGGNSPCVNPRADVTCGGLRDYLKINEAITEVSNQGGGVVYLLEGGYFLHQGGIVLKSNVALVGQGKDTVLWIPAAHDNPIYVIQAANASNMLVSNLYIYGQQSVGQENKAIYFSNVSNSQIHNVWIYSNSEGISISGSNNILSGNTIVGIWVDGKAAINLSGDKNIISNNLLYQNNYGMKISGSNNTVSDNTVDLSTKTGIEFWGTNNLISGNIVARNKEGGIKSIDTGNTSYNTISGNKSFLDGCSICTGTSCTSCFYPTGYAISLTTPGEHNIISGNNIIGPDAGVTAAVGILISSSNSNNIVSENFVKNRFFKVESSNNAIFSNLIQYHTDFTGIITIGPATTGNYLSGNRISTPNEVILPPSFITKIIDYGNNVYTDNLKLTLSPVGECPGSGCTNLVGGQTLTPSGPTSYLILTPSSSITLGNPAIAAGKSEGDLLILQNKTTNTVTLNDGNGVQIKGASADLSSASGKVGSLTLIWDDSNWLEISRMTNP